MLNYLTTHTIAEWASSFVNLFWQAYSTRNNFTNQGAHKVKVLSVVEKGEDSLSSAQESEWDGVGGRSGGCEWQKWEEIS